LGLKAVDPSLQALGGQVRDRGRGAEVAADAVGDVGVIVEGGGLVLAILVCPAQPVVAGFAQRHLACPRWAPPRTRGRREDLGEELLGIGRAQEAVGLGAVTRDPPHGATGGAFAGVLDPRRSESPLAPAVAVADQRVEGAVSTRSLDLEVSGRACASVFPTCSQIGHSLPEGHPPNGSNKPYFSGISPKGGELRSRWALGPWGFESLRPHVRDQNEVLISSASGNVSVTVIVSVAASEASLNGVCVRPSGAPSRPVGFWTPALPLYLSVCETAILFVLTGTVTPPVRV